ncbi:DUF2510 domain-containing protein [Streptomyces sp. M10(2022)]
MSAPTPAPGDESPARVLPDPSIPGYVRYWNGVSWVPGTSRPAPQQGEPAPAVASGPAVDETGPMFFDDEEGERPRRGAGRQPSGAGHRMAGRHLPADRLRRRPRPPRLLGRSGRGGSTDPRRRRPFRRRAGGPAQPAPGDPRRAAAQDSADDALPAMRDGNSEVTDGTVAIRINRPGAPATAARTGTDQESDPWTREGRRPTVRSPCAPSAGRRQAPRPRDAGPGGRRAKARWRFAR